MNKTWIRRVGVVALVMATRALAARPVYRDPQAGVEARVADVLGQLTVEEKVGLCYGAFESGGVPRLGIGQLKALDGRQGLRPGPTQKGTRTTLLPCALALSCTWDVAAAERFGGVLAEELTGMGRQVLLSPNLDLIRSPLSGRNFENFGEDPFLVGSIGSGYIRGAEKLGVAATASLMAANDNEARRHFTSSNMDERTLREAQLLAYEMAVRDGGAWCVMTGNNLINGTHCAQNPHLLNEVLKRDMGYDGPVITDWRAAYDTVPAALAGTDMTTGYCSYVFGEGHLLAAVKSGAVPMALLDDKARRVLRLYARVGLLDATPRAEGTVATPAHRQAAREIAAEGIVLLKNEGALLPLDASKLKRVMVTGPWADAVLQGEGSGHVPAPAAEVSILAGLKEALAGNAEVAFVPYPAMIKPARDNGSAEWDTATTRPAGRKKGRRAATPPTTEKAVDTAALTRAARAADVVVFVASGWLGGEGRDLPEMELPAGQAAAITAIAAVNPHVVVVLQANGAISPAGFGEAVPAILTAHYSGEVGGEALADVLLGKVNPSGRLSYTMARRLGDYAPHALGEWPPKLILAKDPVNPGMKPEDRHATHAFDAAYNEGVFVGHRWFDAKGIEPWFAFGHGLSYTTFEMSGLSVAEVEGGAHRVRCTVRNTGSRDGAEVVQVYVAPPAKSSVPRPVRELKGFARVELKAGESREVEVMLRPTALAFFDATANRWKTEAGEYEVEVGASSRDIRLRAKIVATSQFAERY